MLKTIKSVDSETWARFKSLAAKQGKTMGEFFKQLIDHNEEDSKDFWGVVLNCEKILSDKDACEMKKSSSELRKEYGFRLRI